VKLLDVFSVADDKLEATKCSGLNDGAFGYASRVATSFATSFATIPATSILTDQLFACGFSCTISESSLPRLLSGAL